MSNFYEETPKKYYWLGFIYADGGVTNKYGLRVGLSIKDINHLKKLQKFVGINRKGKFYKLSIYKNKYTSCNLSFGNKKLVKYLEKYSIIPRKTFNVFPKNIPEKFMKYWILGYFDGDGSIFQTKRGDYIASIVGNKKTLNFINEWVKKHCYKSLNIHSHKNIFDIRLGELDSYCFLSRLYDKENLKYCLKRKHDKFLEFKNKIETKFKSLISIYK